VAEIILKLAVFIMTITQPEPSQLEIAFYKLKHFIAKGSRTDSLFQSGSRARE
jgi:hypothetical protein